MQQAVYRALSSAPPHIRTLVGRAVFDEDADALLRLLILLGVFATRADAAAVLHEPGDLLPSRDGWT